MPYCGKCGATISEGSTFCPQCGQPAGTAGGAGQPASVGNTGSGLAENVAGLLCYVFGWITGLVFLLIDKRRFVRFHAAQSIVVFGGLHLLRIVLGIIFGFGWRGGAWSGFAPWGFAGWLFSLVTSDMLGDVLSFAAWGFAGLLFAAMGLLTFILWILLMIKALQAEKFRVPVAADFAEKLAGK